MFTPDAVVVLSIPGQLDESDIGVDDHHYADRPRLNKVDDDSDGFSFKDADADGLSFRDVDDHHELSRNRRRRRPIFESILAVHLADLQRLVTHHDLGTTSQV